MAQPSSEPNSRNSKVSKAAAASLVIAFTVLIVCILAAIFFLPLMSFLGIAMLIGGAIFSVLVAGHYVVWGWWIHRILEDESARRERDL